MEPFVVDVSRWAAAPGEKQPAIGWHRSEASTAAAIAADLDLRDDRGHGWRGHLNRRLRAYSCGAVCRLPSGVSWDRNLACVSLLRGSGFYFCLDLLPCI